MVSPKLAPLTFRTITTYDNETVGWNLPYQLLCSRNLLLGGKGDDVISEITKLRINNSDDIHTFYECIVNIQDKLDFSIETISRTKQLEKYLQAISKSVHHHHLLQFFY